MSASRSSVAWSPNETITISCRIHDQIIMLTRLPCKTVSQQVTACTLATVSDQLQVGCGLWDEAGRRKRNRAHADARLSSVVQVCSGVKPRFSKLMRANLIMIGGPHVMATVSSGLGAMRSSTVVTTPTSHCQPSQSRPMVSTSSMSSRCCRSFTSYQ